MQVPSVFLLIFLTFMQPSNLKKSVYHVTKISSPLSIDANWEKEIWRKIDPIEIRRYMGEKPSHFPRVQAKLAYDDEAIYVIFQVEDQYVRAVAQKHQDGVYKDSCVEFFFSPENNSSRGYFNLEMNCGGTMLFHHQKEPRTGSVHISDEDINQISVAHSLPKQILEEIQDPTIWTVEYRIPFGILTKYHELTKPQKGTIWRANLYKCADDTSHPHWLTWAPVQNPKPNFHLPDFFGELKFM